MLMTRHGDRLPWGCETYRVHRGPPRESAAKRQVYLSGQLIISVKESGKQWPWREPAIRVDRVVGTSDKPGGRPGNETLANDS